VLLHQPPLSERGQTISLGRYRMAGVLPRIAFPTEANVFPYMEGEASSRSEA
jgi:hypothetical protein